LSALVLGNDARRRKALFGGLAVLAVSVFVVGVIVGAWAGFMLDGPPLASAQSGFEPGVDTYAGNVALTCGQGPAGSHGWAPPSESSAALISLNCHPVLSD
jgi:hypothetical protein